MLLQFRNDTVEKIRVDRLDPTRVDPQRPFEPVAVILSGDLDGAELRQVIGHELGVEEREATQPKPRDKLDQGYFGGVSRAGKHALPKERTAKDHAIKPAAVGAGSAVPVLIETTDSRTGTTAVSNFVTIPVQ